MAALKWWLRTQGNSQTISRGEGRAWLSSSSAAHTAESPEWFWHGSSITWDQPSFVQCWCVLSVPAAASGPAPKILNLGQAAVNEARVQRCCFVSRADLGEIQPQQLFQGRAGEKCQTLHCFSRDVLALLTWELVRRNHKMSWAERDPPGVQLLALHRHLNNPTQCLRAFSKHSWSSGGLGTLWICREVLVWFYSKWV